MPLGRPTACQSCKFVSLTVKAKAKPVAQPVTALENVKAVVLPGPDTKVRVDPRGAPTPEVTSVVPPATVVVTV